MKKILKGLGVGIFAFALIVGVGAGSASATLTFDATSVTTDGAFTVTSVAGTTATMFAANTTGGIVIGGASMTTNGTLLYGGTGVGTNASGISGIGLIPGTAGTVNIGKSDGTGTITLGSSSGASQIVNVGTGSGATQTVNIGGGAGLNTINIGTGATGLETIHIGDDASLVNVITIGGAASSLALADAQWGITSPGVATFVNTLVSPSATTGIDVGSAGALSVGRVNATSVVIGSTATTAITLTTDATGDGTDVVLPTGAISTGEILDDTIATGDLSATLTFADGDVVDLSASVTTTAAAKGLKLPQKTDCSLGITEGHICWDTDGDALYIGDGATAAAISPSTASVNTWTAANTFAPTTAGDALIFGGTAQTGGITLGRSTDTNSVSIGSGIMGDSKTQTIQIGNAAANGTTAGGYTVNIAATNPSAANGVNAVTIGNPAVGVANVTINGGTSGAIVIGSTAGTGTITLGSSSGASQIVNVGTGSGATQTVNIGGGAGLNTINIGTGATGLETIHIGDDASLVNVITIGGAASSLALADAQWGITSPGVATFVSSTATTFMSADAYRVTNGTTITATGAIAKSDLQGASYFLANTTGATAIIITLGAAGESFDAGDIGRTITFGHGTNTGIVTVIANDTLTVATVSAGGAAVDAAGDFLDCKIITTTLVTCAGYAQ